MKIFDCFMYFDEEIILGNKLKKYDLKKFPLYINKNLDKFKDWID